MSRGKSLHPISDRITFNKTVFCIENYKRSMEYKAYEFRYNNLSCFKSLEFYWIEDSHYTKLNEKAWFELVVTS